MMMPRPPHGFWVCLLVALLPHRAGAFEGAHSQLPELRDGKLDVHVRAKEDRTRLNFMFWTPVAKAAYSRAESSATSPTHVYGGFFRPSRLGRSMGPQGLEYANPVSFISAAWNRRSEVWELGKHAGFRYVRRATDNGPTSYSAELVVFPLQVVERDGPLAYPFVGGFSRKDADSDGVETQGATAGAAFPLSFLRLSFAVDYAFATEAAGGTVVLIDPF